MDYRKLDELNKLRQSGALTEEEFEQEKKKIMDEDILMPLSLPLGMSESTYLALMSFLILVPYVGWLIPIIMWIMGKDTSTLANRQGKYIFNWYISSFLYSIILGIYFLISLCSSIGSTASLGTVESSNPAELIHLLLGLGGGMLLALFAFTILSVLSILFPIIGGIKGLNGQTFKYPLSIPFLK